MNGDVPLDWDKLLDRMEVLPMGIVRLKDDRVPYVITNKPSGERVLRPVGNLTEDDMKLRIVELLVDRAWENLGINGVPYPAFMRPAGIPPSVSVGQEIKFSEIFIQDHYDPKVSAGTFKYGPYASNRMARVVKTSLTRIDSDAALRICTPDFMEDLHRRLDAVSRSFRGDFERLNPDTVSRMPFPLQEGMRTMTPEEQRRVALLSNLSR